MICSNIEITVLNKETKEPVIFNDNNVITDYLYNEIDNFKKKITLDMLEKYWSDFEAFFKNNQLQIKIEVYTEGSGNCPLC